MKMRVVRWMVIVLGWLSILLWGYSLIGEFNPSVLNNYLIFPYILSFLWLVKRSVILHWSLFGFRSALYGIEFTLMAYRIVESGQLRFEKGVLIVILVNFLFDFLYTLSLYIEFRRPWQTTEFEKR